MGSNASPPVGSTLADTSVASVSFGQLYALVSRRRAWFAGTVVVLMLLCLVYCLVAPRQYESSARVALRMQPSSSLSLDGPEAVATASILSTPLQLETLVNVLRSEQLEWRLITGLKLFKSAAFAKRFAARFPGFDPDHATPEQQSYLLERFGKLLKIRALPRTFLIEIRFRSKDAALSAAVVNELIRDYNDFDSRSHISATESASGWLSQQLKQLTADVEKKERRLSQFERKHNFTTSQQTTPGGQPVEILHDPNSLQLEETGRLLAAATGERILREALYREAQSGMPEQVLAANPSMQAEMGPSGASLLEELHKQSSEKAVELAQLRVEHGSQFPKVVELERAQADLKTQIEKQNADLLEAFRRTWKSAADREQLLRAQLGGQLSEGLRQNDANIEYAVLRQQVDSERELCGRLEKRLREANLSAGIHASSIQVIDWARESFKPVSPDLPLLMAVTFFISLWIGLGVALMVDAMPIFPRFRRFSGRRPASPSAAGVTATLAVLMMAIASQAQAPTPNTQGLPSGVVRLPQATAPTNGSNPQQSPALWNSGLQPAANGLQDTASRPAGVAMALPIAAGDFLDVSEYHVPEFHTSVRVAGDGSVTLPYVGLVRLAGMSEQEASRAVEKALLDGEMLLHPQVTVLVTVAVGQDVSVLGEVARPGVYPFTVHHRLLDLLSSASGLSPNAGRLVSIFRRGDPRTPHPFVLNPGGEIRVNPTTGVADLKADHNPELEPGDTVEVSRAGLVYVMGDVVRPGGFAVDPVQGLTVVQALSLAWGATPNAASSRAVLIRDQSGGRTLTTLNVARMIRGQDPDQPVHDRDILFVPDSTGKALLNRTIESAIQSAVGVSIYAGLVYSQRF